MYLPEELINKHKGKTIGVLGSGPTLNDFKDKINDLCDIVIAVNGSVNVLDSKKHFIDYFICYDSKSFARDWFRKSDGFLQSKNKNGFVRFFDGSKTIRLESEVEEYSYSNKIKRYYYEPKDISHDLNFRLKFGEDLVFNYCTVTGLAAQFAYHMGAERINLFGCSFDNDSGKNYAYIPECEDIGSISNQQIIGMNRVLKKIMKKGVEIVSYGNTRLSLSKIEI